MHTLYQHSLLLACWWVRNDWKENGLWVDLSFLFILCLHFQHKWLANRNKKDCDGVSWSSVFLKISIPSFCLQESSGSNGKPGVSGWSEIAHCLLHGLLWDCLSYSQIFSLPSVFSAGCRIYSYSICQPHCAALILKLGNFTWVDFFFFPVDSIKFPVAFRASYPKQWLSSCPRQGKVKGGHFLINSPQYLFIHSQIITVQLLSSRDYFNSYLNLISTLVEIKF